MSVEQIVQIVMYVLVGLGSIASAVITYIKTGSWNKTTIATAKSLDSQLNELNSNVVRRLDSLESRVDTIAEEVDGLYGEHDSLSMRVNDLDDEVDGLYGDHDSLSRRVYKIEHEEVP